jgi:adenosylhomocysteine nucleosidase
MAGVGLDTGAAAANEAGSSREGPGALGMIAAFRWEVGVLLRRQRGLERLPAKRYRFPLQGRPAILAIAGAGGENSYRTARVLIREFALKGLVSLGFAGGLDESVRPGDLVLAEAVIDSVSGERFHCQKGLLDIPTAHPGVLLSVPEVVTSAVDKRCLGARWGALAVDMESAGVARAAVSAGLPFGAVRSITDASNQSLAIDFQRCQSEHGELSYWKIAWEAFRSPKGISDLVQLAGNSRRAAGNLALALVSF